jgi:hypothetical protein
MVGSRIQTFTGYEQICIGSYTLYELARTHHFKTVEFHVTAITRSFQLIDFKSSISDNSNQ